MTDCETLELLSRVREGDNVAFEKLAEKYKSVIDSSAAKTARSMEKSGLAQATEVIEDLKQEARLALYKAATKYDADGVGREVTFGLYGKICIRNALISELRRAAAKRRRHIRAMAAEEKLRGTVRGDLTESVAISRIEIEDIMGKSSGTLSKYEQTVLRLYIQGKSTAEISEAVKRAPKSVNNALYRIKVKLKGLSK